MKMCAEGRSEADLHQRAISHADVLHHHLAIDLHRHFVRAFPQLQSTRRQEVGLLAIHDDRQAGDSRFDCDETNFGVQRDVPSRTLMSCTTILPSISTDTLYAPSRSFNRPGVRKSVFWPFTTIGKPGIVDSTVTKPTLASNETFTEGAFFPLSMLNT